MEEARDTLKHLCKKVNKEGGITKMSIYTRSDSKDKGKGMSAGRAPGKPGVPGAQTPNEGHGFMGKKPKGKLPMGGGMQKKSAKGKGK